MEKGRNFANIGQNTGVAEQNMQHFMSNSPWSAQGVIQQVQEQIAATPGLERTGWCAYSGRERRRQGGERRARGRGGSITDGWERWI